jgi:hypothetical protein
MPNNIYNATRIRYSDAIPFCRSVNSLKESKKDMPVTDKKNSAVFDLNAFFIGVKPNRIIDRIIKKQRMNS